MATPRTRKSKKSVAEKLKGAQRAQDTMTIYLPGPAKAEWKRLKDEFDQVKASSQGMMVDPPEVKRLAKKMRDLEQQMREDAIDITVQALRRQRTPSTLKDETTWNELQDAHPPRKGRDGKPDQLDASMGVNMESFPEALVRASVIDPVFTAEQWDELLYEVLTDRQFDGLFELCWRLNRAEIDVPFSSLVSKTLRSAPSSRKPSGSGSPASDSKAGNQPK